MAMLREAIIVPPEPSWNAHHIVLTRPMAVGVAMLGDIACNFPLWIMAKRLAAGLVAYPGTFRNLYRGAGTMWMSIGPSTIIEDKVTKEMYGIIEGRKKEIISAAISGACAALTVTSQVEHVITLSHYHGKNMMNTLKYLYREKGLIGLMLPPGMTAMVGREMLFASALFWFRPYVTDNIVQPVRTNNKIDFIKEFICGAITATVLAPISHPAYVIAAYQQRTGTSASRVFRSIYSTDGWKGFWRGLIPRTFSLTGTFTIVPIILHMLLPTP
jgi:hypothetical protein